MYNVYIFREYLNDIFENIRNYDSIIPDAFIKVTYIFIYFNSI